MRIAQVVAAVVVALALAVGSTVSEAGVPQTMNYQGVLKNAAGAPILGSHSMTFRLYNDSTGGTKQWEETQTVSVDSAGLFNVILGTVTSVPDSAFRAQAWLGTSVGADPEMTPRVQLSSVGYAYRVNSIDGAGGGRVEGAVTLKPGTEGSVSLLAFDSRNISSQDVNTGQVFGASTVGASDARLGINVINTDGTGWTEAISVRNGGSVGIGTTNPLATLDVRGAIRTINLGIGVDPGPYGLYIATGDIRLQCQNPRFFIADNAATGYLGTDNSGNMQIAPGSSVSATFAANGSVGIGTTNPIAALDVAGGIRAANGSFFVDELAHDLILKGRTGGTGRALVDLGGQLALNYGPDFAGGVRTFGNLIVDGNVGIGTPSPRSTLDVYGAIGAQGGLRVYGNLVNYHELRHNGTTGALEIAPIGGTNLVIPNGNVGIGTGSPGAKLQVEGATVVNGPGGSVNAITGNTNGAYSGVAGINSGAGPGVYGESHATQGSFGAVTGKAKEDGGIGVYGETWSLGKPGGSGVAVYGWAPASGPSVGGAALGVLGRVNSYQGASASVPVGVFGWATATSGVNAGLFGQTDSPDGFGVYSKGKLEVDGNINTNGVITAGSSSSKISIGTYTASRILTVVQNSATDPIADAWTQYSSRRWKENIVPITGALDKVSRLRGVYFDWKRSGKHDLGMIAEEVGEVLPEIVQYEDNGRDAQSLDYSRLTAVLVEAVKELKAENDSLRNRLSRLEAAGQADAASLAPASNGSQH